MRAQLSVRVLCRSAADIGDLPMSELLLRAGADIDAQLPDGRTALHLSASGGATEVVRMLLDAGQQ